ncbi:ribonuclease H2 subunit B-like [Pyrus ussuriensis x Pyrus communis]|uniref:Ribonuclease H2 subunit B-like n=1 Tax=Pyrus ussuriensis x Pyrus communis TaxID=2448454 RepID=A0A5N5HNP6_9ROSA|nr:ribonuclease H2 subunit B-like [Pyrus ussuriensis x Pyrus communis]
MAWWEGFEETRLLIAADTTESGNDVGQLISLRHPKSDAGLYTATPVDPVFIFLPIFEEARMKKGDVPGKFRLLDDIIFIEGYPGYHKLLSIAENCLQLVCEKKRFLFPSWCAEVGSSKLFRLDDSKVLAWLYHKVLTDAVSVLGEYVKDEPWLKLLSDRLSIDFTEATRKMSDIEFLPTATGSNLGPCNGSQGESEIKPTQAGRQAKKAKMETESHNIRAMFTRASSRRKK